MGTHGNYKCAETGTMPDAVGSTSEGVHKGGFDSHVHGKESRHEKFGGPNSLKSHEVFKNESKRPSTVEAHEKFFAHVK